MASKIGGGPRQRVPFSLAARAGGIDHPEPNGFDVASRGVLGRRRVSQGNRGNEMLMLIDQHPGPGIMIPEGLLVKLEQPGPRLPPTLPQTGHPRHLDDPFMQLEIARAE